MPESTVPYTESLFQRVCRHKWPVLYDLEGRSFQGPFFWKQDRRICSIPYEMWLLEVFRGREERPLGRSSDQTNCVSKDFQNWPLKSAADSRGYHSCPCSLSLQEGWQTGDRCSGHPKHYLMYHHCFYLLLTHVRSNNWCGRWGGEGSLRRKLEIGLLQVPTARLEARDTLVKVSAVGSLHHADN